MPCLAIPLVIEAHTHEHSFDERAHHLLFACVDVCILELTDTEIRIHSPPSPPPRPRATFSSSSSLPMNAVFVIFPALS